MGCGTGRILIPAARNGARVHGLDLSQGMLDRLRQQLDQQGTQIRRRVTLTQGDMRTVRLAEQFALIMAPFRVVQHLTTRRDQKAWLRNVARHLTADGLLAFDVFQPDFRLMLKSGQAVPEIDYTDPSNGVRTVRSMQMTPHFECQLLDIRFQWERFDSEGLKMDQSEGNFTFRWFTKSELESLMELEGFEVVNFWGSFDRQAFGEGSAHQVVEARFQKGAV